MPQFFNIDRGREPLEIWLKEQLAAGVRLIALEGFCGRGKSTLARAVCEALPGLTHVDGDDFAIEVSNPSTWRDWMKMAELGAFISQQLAGGGAVLLDSAVAWGALGEITAQVRTIRIHLRLLQSYGQPTDDLECLPGVPTTPLARTLCDYHCAEGRQAGALADAIVERTELS